MPRDSISPCGDARRVCGEPGKPQPVASRAPVGFFENAKNTTLRVEKTLKQIQKAQIPPASISSVFHLYAQNEVKGVWFPFRGAPAHPNPVRQKTLSQGSGVLRDHLFSAAPNASGARRQVRPDRKSPHSCGGEAPALSKVAPLLPWFAEGHQTPGPLPGRPPGLGAARPGAPAGGGSPAGVLGAPGK